MATITWSVPVSTDNWNIRTSLDISRGVDNTSSGTTSANVYANIVVHVRVEFMVRAIERSAALYNTCTIKCGVRRKSGSGIGGRRGRRVQWHTPSKPAARAFGCSYMGVFATYLLAPCQYACNFQAQSAYNQVQHRERRGTGTHTAIQWMGKRSKYNMN